MNPKLAQILFIITNLIAVPVVGYAFYEFFIVKTALANGEQQIPFDSGTYYLLLGSIFWVLLVVQIVGKRNPNSRDRFETPLKDLEKLELIETQIGPSKIYKPVPLSICLSKLLKKKKEDFYKLRNALNKLAKECHKIAKDKGFWDEPRSYAHCMGLVISELGEAINADRAGKRACRTNFEQESDFKKIC